MVNASPFPDRPAAPEGGRSSGDCDTGSRDPKHNFGREKELQPTHECPAEAAADGPERAPRRSQRRARSPSTLVAASSRAAESVARRVGTSIPRRPAGTRRTHRARLEELLDSAPPPIGAPAMTRWSRRATALILALILAFTASLADAADATRGRSMPRRLLQQRERTGATPSTTRASPITRPAAPSTTHTSAQDGARLVRDENVSVDDSRA